jgi:hypothetical protein
VLAVLCLNGGLLCLLLYSSLKENKSKTQRSLSVLCEARCRPY